MRNARFALAGAALLAGCTFSSVKPEVLVGPGESRPRVLVLGSISLANLQWEPHRFQFTAAVTEWLKRNGAFESVLAERPAALPADCVILSGTITEVDPGSAVLRFFVGMGAGQAQVNGRFAILAPSGATLAQFQAHEAYLGGTGIGGGSILNIDDVVKRFGETVAAAVAKWARGEPIGDVAEGDRRPEPLVPVTGSGAAPAAGSGSSTVFEQQLDQLDEFKARGQISDEEYAARRRQLIEGLTPGALTTAAVSSVATKPAPATSTPGPSGPGPLAPALAQLIGTWNGEATIRAMGGAPQGVPIVLRIYPEGDGLSWTLTRRFLATGRWLTASGVVQLSDTTVTLTGRYDDQSTPLAGSPLSYTLTLDGASLTGTGVATGDRLVHAISLTRQAN